MGSDSEGAGRARLRIDDDYAGVRPSGVHAHIAVYESACCRFVGCVRLDGGAAADEIREITLERLPLHRSGGCFNIWTKLGLHASAKSSRRRLRVLLEYLAELAALHPDGSGHIRHTQLRMLQQLLGLLHAELLQVLMR